MTPFPLWKDVWHVSIQEPASALSKTTQLYKTTITLSVMTVLSHYICRTNCITTVLQPLFFLITIKIIPKSIVRI
jgi:hypothetical protein